MNTVDEKICNGNTLHYTIADNGVAVATGITLKDGSFTDYEVSEKLIRTLASLVHDGHRYRFWYGRDGKVWNEYYDVSGYVGKSKGRIQVPIMLKTRKSVYGGVILSEIMRIDRIDTKHTVYIHPRFRLPEFRFEENKDGRFRVFAVYETACEDVFYTDSKNKAERFIAFMTGKRYAP